MFQQSTLIRRIRTQPMRWLSLLAVFMALWLAQSAQAIGLQLIFIHAPQQRIDTDGDGSLDFFSADFAVNSDNTASGVIFLDSDSKIKLQSGHIVWTSSEEKAVLDGVHYQKVNGQWQATGNVQVEAKPAGGGSGPDFQFQTDASATVFMASGEWQREYVAGVMAPAAQVDTDGDGQLDDFSADLLVLNDGPAVGTIQLDSDDRIVVESGATLCLAGEAAVVVYGTRYQQINGLWQAVGDSRAQGRPAGGGGGGDIVLFDIIDSVPGQAVSFEALAELPLAADPCAG
ncbi:MAG: hypothetical protein L0332_33130 [Chloroflexi bacterium]|nr:hypothetical protein [Chloroflexota bacterium]MCI0647060.1 hypothetical protein [Chloroflexota bacterium]MCI0731547.1 hypothetical protein [Chloroflexota bacterium]